MAENNGPSISEQVEKLISIKN